MTLGRFVWLWIWVFLSLGFTTLVVAASIKSEAFWCGVLGGWGFLFVWMVARDMWKDRETQITRPTTEVKSAMRPAKPPAHTGPPMWDGS